jgi:hypothetical protein
MLLLLQKPKQQWPEQQSESLVQAFWVVVQHAPLTQT